jgi:hypothetical protein
MNPQGKVFVHLNNESFTGFVVYMQGKMVLEDDKDNS